MKERKLTQREIEAYENLRKERIFNTFCDELLEVTDIPAEKTVRITKEKLQYIWWQWCEQNNQPNEELIYRHYYWLRRWSNGKTSVKGKRKKPHGLGWECYVMGITWKVGKWSVLPLNDKVFLTRI